MLKCRVVRYFTVLVFFVNSVYSETLDIEDGKIEGTVMRTRTGEAFHAFLRIPFAEPPIGHLRFRSPVPKSPWTTILNCTSYGPICMQPDIWQNFPIAEDCLHLNIFTKSLSPGVFKPVIVFIHGGAFESGSAIEHGPEYLMERDVVLVTVNYRLGVFGFLALETSEIYGNAGLKDQSLALTWIQKNIKYFGGNNGKVTLAGLSAGGFSATAHMISPMSQGLFHNVIAMSGALTWQKKLKTNNFDAAKALATKINCPLDSNEMIKCFMQKPAEELAEHEVISYFHCPVMTWMPVVELHGAEKFLIDDPNALFRSGKFPNVNVMVGLTADEFISPVASILEDSNLTKILNDKFDDIGPICWFFEESNLKTSKEIGQELKKIYLPFDTIDRRSFTSLNNLFADSVIGYAVHKFVHYTSMITDVYYYKFSYVGRFSLFMYPNDKPYGVHHADDIQYVFNAKYVGPTIATTDPENIYVQRMTRIWEQFAKTGNPNNNSDEYLKDLYWHKHDDKNEYFMEIGNHFVEKQGLFLERFKVWENMEINAGENSKLPNFIVFITSFFIIYLKQKLS